MHWICISLGFGDFQPVPRSKSPCKWQFRQDPSPPATSKSHAGLETKQYLESDVIHQHSLLTLTCLAISKSQAFSTAQTEASHSQHAEAVGHLSPPGYSSGFLRWTEERQSCPMLQQGLRGQDPPCAGGAAVTTTVTSDFTKASPWAQVNCTTTSPSPAVHPFLGTNISLQRGQHWVCPPYPLPRGRGFARCYWTAKKMQVIEAAEHRSLELLLKLLGHLSCRRGCSWCRHGSSEHTDGEGLCKSLFRGGERHSPPHHGPKEELFVPQALHRLVPPPDDASRGTGTIPINEHCAGAVSDHPPAHYREILGDHLWTVAPPHLHRLMKAVESN